MRVPAAPASARLRHGHVHQHGSAGPGVPDPDLHLRPDPDARRTATRARTSRAGATRRPRTCSTSPTSTVDEDARAKLITDALELVVRRGLHAAAVPVPEVGLLPQRQGRRTGRGRAQQLPRLQQLRGSGRTSTVTARSSSAPSSGPECLNPVTECSNSSWYLWTARVPAAPGVWRHNQRRPASSSPTWSPASRSSKSSDPRDQGRSR